MMKARPPLCPVGPCGCAERTRLCGMREAQIKVKAFAVLLNRSLDAHLVWLITDLGRSGPGH